MARPGPRKIRAYSLEFKLTAVRLSEQPGIQVQAVAAALDIHPYMLSKWRKQVRDGVLRGKGRPLTVPPLREIQRLQELERALRRYVYYHNHQRRHSALAYRSPADYESWAA